MSSQVIKLDRSGGNNTDVEIILWVKSKYCVRELLSSPYGNQRHRQCSIITHNLFAVTTVIFFVPVSSLFIQLLFSLKLF